jgi:hypothetical protein
MKIWGAGTAERAALLANVRRRADKVLARILADESENPGASDRPRGPGRIVGSRRRRRVRPRHAAPPARFGSTFARTLSGTRFTNRSAARAG